MRTIMARTLHDSSSSSSKRHLQWATKKPGSGGNSQKRREGQEDGGEVEDTLVAFAAAAAPIPASYRRSSSEEGRAAAAGSTSSSREEGRAAAAATLKKKGPGAGAATATAVSRLRAAFMAAIAAGRLHRLGAGGSGGLGSRVTGTLFGQRRGHVHFAFQVHPKDSPVLLIELPTLMSGLVREMASGLVRIALECERKSLPAAPDGGGGGKKAAARRLLEEPLWRTYCNGRKCGYSMRRECGPTDWRVLRAVEPVSMGAGVLPAAKAAAAAGKDEEGSGSGSGVVEGETMYMRARFERVVGSRDSEAFYMMNPDGNGGPELSIYLLRV